MSIIIKFPPRQAMAHINKVITSHNSELGDTCVDIFVRPDGSFGFEEYRRDHEDGRGWFPIGHFSSQNFTTADNALAAAMSAVPWLQEILGSN